MLAPRRTLHSTPLVVFRKALEVICATKDDVLYDVGCGDGRCVVDAASRLQIRSIGIEIDPDRAAQASAAVRDAGVEELATIIIGNAMEYDFEDATIIFLFLIERGLRLILPKLQQRTRPCRVVTYLYKIPGIAFSSRHVVPVKESSNDVAFPIFVYEFPAADESDNISLSA